MQCQLCVAYGGQPTEIEDNDWSAMCDHVKNHQWQSNELSQEAWKVYSNWCFPNVDLDSNLMNGNTSGISNIQVPGGQGNLIEPAPLVPPVNQIPVEPATKSGFSTPASSHCLQLLKTYSKNGRIQCHKCNTLVNIVGGNNYCHTRTAIDHVAKYHLNLNLYQCNHCGLATPGMVYMAKHLKNVHRHAASGNYVDRIKNYPNEIITALNECFHGPVQNDGNSMGVVNGGRPFLSNQMPASRHRIAKNSTAVSILCMKVLKENSQGGKICCRICSRDLCIGIGRLNTRTAINHVLAWHMPFELYRCNICQVGAKSMASIYNHISFKHNVSSIGNYTDHSDQYKREIMDMILKCFGKDPNKDMQSMENGQDAGSNTGSAMDDGPSTSGSVPTRQVIIDLSWFEPRYVPQVIN